MAEIKPLRAWRYSDSLDVDEITSPLFDVVSEKQKRTLYKYPLNSIHLSVPEGPNPADRARKLLDKWKQDGTIVCDKLPGIYVYYQYFKAAGSLQENCRKGFVAHIRVYDWEDHVIQRHENTIRTSVNDRIALLSKTQLHVSPSYGTYIDEKRELEKYMDEAITQPIYEMEDYQGARDRLAVIHDAEVIQKFLDNLRSKQVILADGYPCYESSLLHRNERKKDNPAHTGNEGYNFHLMYLTGNPPQESAYFYPKLICGFLFSSIKEDEFKTPYYSRF